jgi:hypothetical protein
MFKQLPSKTILPLRNLTLLLAALVAQDCRACYSPPAQQLMSVDEQIMRASDVSVAQVMSATPVEGNVVEYRFFVLQRLAGPDRAVFTVMGRGEPEENPAFLRLIQGQGAGERKDSTFDNHTDPAFWKRGGGRVMNDPDCVVHPSFAVGASYLVFLGAPVTWRSFEEIAAGNGQVNERDKWLAHVKAGLGERRASAALTPGSAPPH